MPRKLWEHPNPKSTAMWHFMQESNKRYNLNLKVCASSDCPSYCVYSGSH